MSYWYDDGYEPGDAAGPPSLKGRITVILGLVVLFILVFILR